jgi:hypothetical protein
MSGFDDLGDGVRKIFLAGVGAVALGAEKSQEVVSDLVKKGELTVEQGKMVNEELRQKFRDATDDASQAMLTAKLKAMSSEERAAWVSNVQNIASKLDAETVEVEVESDGEVKDGAAKDAEGDGEDK